VQLCVPRPGGCGDHTAGAALRARR